MVRLVLTCDWLTVRMMPCDWWNILTNQKPSHRGPEDAQEDNLEDDGEDVDYPSDHHGLYHPGLGQAPDQAKVEQDVDEEKSLKIVNVLEISLSCVLLNITNKILEGK